jgi:hypothetical protein
MRNEGQRYYTPIIPTIIRTFVMRSQATSGSDIDEQDGLSLEIFQGDRFARLLYLHSESAGLPAMRVEGLTFRSYRDILAAVLIGLVQERSEESVRVDLEIAAMFMLYAGRHLETEGDEMAAT